MHRLVPLIPLLLSACWGKDAYIVEGVVLERTSPTEIVVDHEPVEGLMPAMVMNWTIGRFLYRFGYKSKNPYRRLFGMTYSMAVCVPAIPYGLYKFAAEVMLQK